MDEAHHFPAATWKRIVDHFQGAKVGILFLTATPYKQGRNILTTLNSSGVMIKKPCYEYPIDKAIKDGIIREIKFFEENGTDPVESVLKKVEETLRCHDSKDGRRPHKAMVLATDINHAKEIERVWNEKIKFGTCKTYVQADSWNNVKAFIKLMVMWLLPIRVVQLPPRTPPQMRI